MSNENKPTYGCESCYHYIEDDEIGDFFCEIDLALDEDECRTYGMGASKKCPFYRYNDEYISVRKQN